MIIRVASVWTSDPEIAIIYDVGPIMTAAGRQELLSIFADGHTLLAVPQLPFRGIGHSVEAK